MTNDMMSADCRVQALSRSDIEEDRKQQIIANLQSAADGGQVAAAKASGAAYNCGTGVTFAYQVANLRCGCCGTKRCRGAVPAWHAAAAIRRRRSSGRRARVAGEVRGWRLSIGPRSLADAALRQSPPTFE